MKLLLTSAGLMNKKIARELLRLAARPAKKLKVAFIPTAANVEEGDKGWFMKDLQLLQKQKFAAIDIVDISALPKHMWEKRLRVADIFVVSGGNTFHLMHWMNKSGLSKLLPQLLKTRVYVGISAGSIVTNPTLKLSSSERLEYLEKPVMPTNKGLNFVPFGIRPHLNSPWFKDLRISKLQKLFQDTKLPFYALDDQSAVSVDGKKITVISEGRLKKFE